MPRFAYKAKTSSAAVVEGALEAETTSDAVQQLGAMGYFPLRLEKEPAAAAGAAASRGAVHGKIPIAELSVCLRQLSDLLDAGLPLFSAIETAAEQCAHPRLKAVLEGMAAQVREGKTLSQTMRDLPEVFAPFYVHLVQAGETGGMLGKVLTRLADYAEKRSEVRSQVTAALAYPAFIVMVGVGTVCFVLGVIIPRLAVLFADFHQSLPLPTRILLNLSALFQHDAWLLLIAAAAACAAARKWGTSERWTLRRDRLLLRIPALREWIVSQELAQFSRTLGALLENGVPILQALAVSEKTLDNRAFRQSVSSLQEPVRHGVPLSQALKSQAFFPANIRNLVAVGEEGGGVDKALLKIADRYDGQAQRGLKVAMSLLEPTLILFIGVILGGVILSIMLPIFEINTLIH